MKILMVPVFVSDKPIFQQSSCYSANISTRLRNDTYISLESVEKICRVLDCGIDDVVEFVPDESKNTEESCHE